MQLTHTGARFEARSSFEERHALKGAGFRFDWDRKTWWTSDAAKAAKFVDFADDAARTALAKHLDTVKASRAAAAPTTAEDQALPVPAGRSYLPYQEAGIRYALSRPSTLFGDEMGLGKTVQALGVVNASPDAKRVLVVCPASLRLNWLREATRWLVREFRITVITNGEALDLAGDDAQLVIINYDRLSKRPELNTASWDILIIDEAHYAKNPKAARSKHVYALAARSKRVLALTGTPILNRPIELHPIVSMLDRATWGNFWGYAKRYCAAHQKWAGRKLVWDLDGASNLDELQERLRGSVMVRRLKADVLTELPPKRYSYVPLLVKGYEDSPEAAKLRERLETLSELRSVAAELGNAAGAEEYEAEQGRALAVAFTEMSTYRRQLGLAKAAAAVEYVQELLDGGVAKVVVFAHHQDVSAALQKAFGADAVAIYGDTSLEDRQAAVDRFQADASCRVFVGSIMAAGVGLTLTAASTVVFVETDWVPANLAQAEDRCHRIGQHDTVQIHYLTVPGSLDEYMLALVEAKADVAAKALDRAAAPVVLPEPVAPKEPVVRAAARPQAEIPTARKEALLVALRALAGSCDGAKRMDGEGFNKIDASFGHALAALATLTDRQFLAASKMVRKYRRQLGDAALEAIG